MGAGILKANVRYSLSSNQAGDSVVEAIARIQRELTTAIRLAVFYRSNPSVVEMRAGELNDLVSDIAGLLLPDSRKQLEQGEGISLNRNLANALVGGLEASYARLPKHDFALTVIAPLDQGDRQSHSIEWEDTTASLDPKCLQFIQQEVHRLCPPAFRKIVARVVFMNLSPEKANGWHKAGSYLLDEDTGYASIRINLVPFQKDPVSVLSVILHEIAHAGHDSFPIALLKLWEDEIQSEADFNVTPYTAKVRSENKRRLKAEDFAESFRLFCLEPDELRRISSHRYFAMQKICALMVGS